MSGIVVGIDQSAHAHNALDWAMREAAARRSALTVVTVISAMASSFSGRPLTVPDSDNAIKAARAAADEAVGKAASEIGERQPTSVTVSSFTGFPAQALIDASRDAELVVVGSRGAGGFATLLLGSVSSQVAHHAACPVVIVPSAR
jgi:nucleotide-binding universal stress UspA family protein